MRFINLTLALFCFSQLYGQGKYPYLNSYNSTNLICAYDISIINNIGDDHSQRVILLFQQADRNNDKKISLDELQIFQNWLVNSYKYKNNETALTPDDFITQGGGDCEDFAIMTCCMLNYHGVVAYVAGFGKVTVNKHAVCLLKIKEPIPPGFLYYTINYWNVPDGYYTPIDYEKIGGLKAIDRRWKIARINKPVDMFGKYW